MPSESNQSLDAFLDGELSPAEAPRVAAMLNADDQAYLAAARDAGDRLRAAPLPVPSAGAQIRWLNHWQIARDRSVRRLAGWMTAAAAAVAIGFTLSSAFTGTVHAQPLADWETAAVGQADDDDAPRTARLIAIDLALPAASSSTEGGR